MKKRILLGATVFTLIAMMASCSKLVRKFGSRIDPSPEVVSKSYTFDNIQGISAAFGIIVHYAQQPQTAPIKVTGPQNVVDALEIKKDELQTLSLEIPDGDKFNYASDDERLHVWISAPNVSSFQAISEAVINVSDTLKSNKSINVKTYIKSIVKFKSIQAEAVNLESYIDSEITVSNIHTDKLDAASHNGSVITIAGNAKATYLTASNATINAMELTTKQPHVSELLDGEIKLTTQNTDIE